MVASGRVDVENAVQDALETAGILAGVKRPTPLPDGPWVRYFVNGGPTDGARVRGRAVTDRQRIELEGYAPNLDGAWNVLDAAIGALLAAIIDPGSPIRAVADDSAPVSLPTGEDGLERYTAAVIVTTRRT